jgi:hypothetical protein
VLKARSRHGVSARRHGTQSGRRSSADRRGPVESAFARSMRRTPRLSHTHGDGCCWDRASSSRGPRSSRSDTADSEAPAPLGCSTLPGRHDRVRGGSEPFRVPIEVPVHTTTDIAAAERTPPTAITTATTSTEPRPVEPWPIDAWRLRDSVKAHSRGHQGPSGGPPLAPPERSQPHR